MSFELKKIILSLEKDINRRNIFFTQAHTSDFEVFDAINFMDRSLDSLNEVFDLLTFECKYGRKPTKGEIGCTLSHIQIYQKILNDSSINDDDYVLICEDDALFAMDFNENLLKILNSNLSKDVDILLLGQSKIRSFNDLELEINYPTTFWGLQKNIFGARVKYSYPYLNYYAGTVAYLISKQGAEKILNILSKKIKPFWLADDFRLFQIYGINTMSIRPLLVIENPIFDSNLEKDRKSKQAFFISKILKYPIKKVLAVWRNLIGRI